MNPNAAQDGKLGGRPRLEATKFREALIKQAEEKAGPLAEALVKKALLGDVPALREILDRTIGKPTQGIDVTSAGEKLNDPTPTNEKLEAIRQEFERKLRESL